MPRNTSNPPAAVQRGGSAAAWIGGFSGLLLAASLTAGALASETPAAKPFLNSFEDPAELSDWQCQQGITTELTSAWATDGKTSLQINVPAGTPWFGIQRDVMLEEFRRHEFLEFDLHAVTDVDFAAFKMHADKYQDLMVNHDRLKPGETIHVRIRLADNEIVRFGDSATISIWMGNKTAVGQTILVDNVRLTGSGGEGALLDGLRSRIMASNLTTSAATALLADCEAGLA
jgi:hypothetical protein